MEIEDVPVMWISRRYLAVLAMAKRSLSVIGLKFVLPKIFKRSSLEKSTSGASRGHWSSSFPASSFCFFPRSIAVNSRDKGVESKTRLLSSPDHCSAVQYLKLVHGKVRRLTFEQWRRTSNIMVFVSSVKNPLTQSFFTDNARSG